MRAIDSTKVIVSDSRTFTTSDLIFASPDTRFKNYWGNKGGKPEQGGIRGGTAKMTRLAFSTMRQMRLTGAGRDVQWYSVNWLGGKTDYLRFDSVLVFEGKQMTAEQFYTYISLIAALTA